MDEFETSSKILDDGGNDITIPFDHKLADEEREVVEKEHNATIIEEHGPMAQISSEPGNYALGTYLYKLRKNN